MCFAAFLLSCSTDEDKEKHLDDNFECVLQNSNAEMLRTKDDVLHHIYGTWKVMKILSMIPDVNVGNMKLEFKDILGAPIDKQVAELYIDDKSVGSIVYSIKEQKVDNEILLLFESEVATFSNSDEYNFMYFSSLRMCPEEMLIDNGMASDGPGYLLKKIK